MISIKHVYVMKDAQNCNGKKKPAFAPHSFRLELNFLPTSQKQSRRRWELCSGQRSPRGGGRTFFRVTVR